MLLVGVALEYFFVISSMIELTWSMISSGPLPRLPVYRLLVAESSDRFFPNAATICGYPKPAGLLKAPPRPPLKGDAIIMVRKGKRSSMPPAAIRMMGSIDKNGLLERDPWRWLSVSRSETPPT